MDCRVKPGNDKMEYDATKLPSRKERA